MNAYIYRAALICEACAKSILSDLYGLTPETCANDPDAPQGPYPSGGGEADRPNHCDCDYGCDNALETPSGRKIGVFLENPITSDGRRFVEKACKEDLAMGDALTYSVALEVWAPFYKVSLEPDDE